MHGLVLNAGVKPDRIRTVSASKTDINKEIYELIH
jgi:hypothetical protein